VIEIHPHRGGPLSHSDKVEDDSFVDVHASAGFDLRMESD
jgi:hypothetical protein